jgi:putative endonuclease
VAGHVYILASRRNGTLYTGVTTDLPKRIYEHRTGIIPGFTRRHGVKRLVHVETHHDVTEAIVRERRIKEWRRAWKLDLIERDNPDWTDLAVTLLGFDPLPEIAPSRHPGESRDPDQPSQRGPGVRRDD